MDNEYQRKLSSEHPKAHHPHDHSEQESNFHEHHENRSPYAHTPRHHCELHKSSTIKKPFESGGETLITESLEGMTDNVIGTISSAKDAVCDFAEKIIEKCESCIMPQSDEQTTHHSKHPHHSRSHDE